MHMRESKCVSVCVGGCECLVRRLRQSVCNRNATLHNPLLLPLLLLLLILSSILFKFAIFDPQALVPLIRTALIEMPLE